MIQMTAERNKTLSRPPLIGSRKANGIQNSDVYRRQQNEKVIFWNIAFDVGNSNSYSNDGKGRYRR
jgi:hypothetical protein